MENPPQPLRPPIERLPLVGQLIETELSEARVQYANLQQARSYPHVQGDAIIERVIRVYIKHLDGAFLFEKQLSLWKQEEDLTHVQKAELARLTLIIEQLKAVLADTLVEAEELQKGAIERMLATSDLERVLEFLKK